MSRNLKKKCEERGEKVKGGKKLKPEHIAYIVLGVLVLAVVITVVVVLASASGGGSSPNVVLPCCQ